MGDYDRYRRPWDRITLYIGLVTLGGAFAAWISGLLDPAASPTPWNLLLLVILMVPVVLIAVVLTRWWTRPSRRKVTRFARMAGAALARGRTEAEPRWVHGLRERVGCFGAAMFFFSCPIITVALIVWVLGFGWWPLVLIGLIPVAVIALIAAGTVPPGPTPDEVGRVMERRYPERKAYIDALVRLGDCAALRAVQEVAFRETAPYEVRDYISAAWEAACCQPVGYTFDDTRRFMAYHYPDRKAEIDGLAEDGDLAALAAAGLASFDAREPAFISEYVGWLLHSTSGPDQADGPDAPERPPEVVHLQPNRLSILSDRDLNDR